ncbi:dephospho-CoA kinase [candidate division TA06 bacterium]|uniref:Dephospho-CoA kinase n=1 Tax=candidate division TA06 bacterium TaxID=2250710 RepID=A0A660S4X4_UNCT6|nr:MAG: dephospho-CoA kinase [candidate division TA06 bacterium]
MKIGIAGPIASGKSLVASQLSECLHIPKIDADKIGHEIIETFEIKEKLKNEFGKSIIVDEKIDRKMLGKIVFSDKSKLTALNNIFYSPFRKRILKELSDNDDVILEMAILHQYRLENFLDTILFVTAKKELRVKRLIEKELPKEEALKRINVQNITVYPGDVLVENNFECIDDFKEYLKKLCELLN